MAADRSDTTYNNENPAFINAFRVTMTDILLQVFRLWRTMKRHESYFETRVQELLVPLLPEKNQLKPSSLVRIRKYWELSLHFICGSFYERNGWKLIRREEENILRLSLLSPFYDDLFEEGIDTERIKSLTADPHRFQPAHPKENIVCTLYCSILESLNDPFSFKSQFLQVFHWQQRSLQQKDITVSEAALAEIMIEKSYHSFLLFYRLLERFPSTDELDLMRRVAGLLQFTNDVFDVYKDVQHNVCTIPNLYGDYSKLRKWLLKEVRLLNGQLAALSFPVKAKKKNAITFHAMNAMCLLALEQLGRNTGGKADIAQLRTMHRKELVCDMDGFWVKIKWLWKVKALCGMKG
ncbi:MAG: hypothetical protein ACO1NW_05335 [Chitinophagaceae bacterium]